MANLPWKWTSSKVLLHPNQIFVYSNKCLHCLEYFLMFANKWSACPPPQAPNWPNLSHAYFSMQSFALHFGPSEVLALPVRRCRRAAWQTKWPLNSLLVRAKSWTAHASLQTGCMANEVATKFIVFFSSSFLFLSFFLSSVPYYFSPRRGCPRVVKICVCTY